MLKKYYNILAGVFILVGLSLLFISTMSEKESINSFAVSNQFYSGAINDIKNSEDQSKNNYLGVLEIPKINLRQGFFEYGSPLNTVDKNIEVIETSQMPDIENSNLILAAHSGNSAIAYFKHLDQLEIGDIVYINYQDKQYKYIIDNIYDKNKTGYIEIIRDKDKNTITLITCKKNTNMQTVFIGYLAN